MVKYFDEGVYLLNGEKLVSPAEAGSLPAPEAARAAQVPVV